MLSSVYIGGGRFDEPHPPAPDPNEPQEAVAPPDPDAPGPCQQLDGSDEVELFAEREVGRCTVTVSSDDDGKEFTLTTEAVGRGFGETVSFS